MKGDVICCKAGTMRVCTGCRHSRPHAPVLRYGVVQRCTKWAECLGDGCIYVKVRCTRELP